MWAQCADKTVFLYNVDDYALLTDCAIPNVSRSAKNPEAGLVIIYSNLWSAEKRPIFIDQKNKIREFV